MILFDITELQTLGAFDRGIPNRERVVIVAREPVNLGRYALAIGLKANDSMAVPFKDSVFWFGNIEINKDDLIFIYTGEGNPTVSPGVDEGKRIFTGHWGRKQTIFNHQEFVPMLIRLDGVMIDTFQNPNPAAELPKNSEFTVKEFLRLLNSAPQN